MTQIPRIVRPDFTEIEANLILRALDFFDRKASPLEGELLEDDRPRIYAIMERLKV